MTRNKIIASLEEQATDKEDFVDKDDADDVFSLDIQALREAAELLRHVGVDRSRWKGCDMCQTDYDREDWRDGNPHDFRVEGDSLFHFDSHFGWEGTVIKFCPECGRPLTEEAWAELERRMNGGTTYNEI